MLLLRLHSTRCRPSGLDDDEGFLGWAGLSNFARSCHLDRDALCFDFDLANFHDMTYRRCATILLA